MKPSEILREAARIAHEQPYNPLEWRCGCGAIADAAEGAPNSSAKKASVFFGLFKPDDEWRIGWFGPYWRDHPDADAAKKHRVIALCLAAAIAESEGD